MSVRFFKIFSGVLLAHVVLTSVVWVGFSAPFPRPPAIFTYEGALPAEDAVSAPEGASPQGLQSDDIDRFQDFYADHWIKLREPSRSLNNDHLGF